MNRRQGAAADNRQQLDIPACCSYVEQMFEGSYPGARVMSCIIVALAMFVIVLVQQEAKSVERKEMPRFDAADRVNVYEWIGKK